MSLYSCTYMHQVQKYVCLHMASFANTVETLHYGLPRKVYNIADTSFDPECIYVCLCTIKSPEMRKPLYSVKWSGFPVPTLPELY